MDDLKRVIIDNHELGERLGLKEEDVIRDGKVIMRDQVWTKEALTKAVAECRQRAAGADIVENRGHCASWALAAMASFGYLYNNRSAAMMHALPLRREALFTTQYLAGLSCLLLPHLAVALVTSAAELAFLPMECWGEALAALAVWLLVQSGTALFFFSFAAFCAMFTGHILALPAFYVILNFLVMVISTLLAELMNRFFYGFPGRGWVGGRLVEWCTPVYLLSQACN